MDSDRKIKQDLADSFKFKGLPIVIFNEDTNKWEPNIDLIINSEGWSDLEHNEYIGLVANFHNCFSAMVFKYQIHRAGNA